MLKEGPDNCNKVLALDLREETVGSLKYNVAHSHVDAPVEHCTVDLRSGVKKQCHVVLLHTTPVRPWQHDSIPCTTVVTCNNDAVPWQHDLHTHVTKSCNSDAVLSTCNTLWRNQHSDLELLCPPRIRCVAFACITDSSQVRCQCHASTLHLQAYWYMYMYMIPVCSSRKQWREHQSPVCFLFELHSRTVHAGQSHCNVFRRDVASRILVSGWRPSHLSSARARSVRTTALAKSAFVFNRTFEHLLVLGFENQKVLPPQER